MNLEELYIGYASSGDAHRRAEGLLNQTHWISCLVDFDPKTGRPMPACLTEVLRRSSNVSDEGFPKDRVWRAIEHSRTAVQRLIMGLTEEPRRMSEYMPIRDVRELDTSSFVALSRRPGRNIREKLADKPYMQAVRHYQSSDTTENRLLKAYVLELVELLTLRHDYLGESDALLSTLQRWLRSDEALSISRWENLPPNNTLISHRDYRRVWDSWRWLQTIDDDIDRDNEDYTRRCQVRNRWNQLASAYAAGETQFAEMPVIVDWNGFDIRPWDPALVRRQKKTKRSAQRVPITRGPTSVDLTLLTPAYASDGDSGLLASSFIWQCWSNEREGDVEICLFGSDAVMEHPDSRTVMSPDLLFSKQMSKYDLNAAASAFAERMSQLFETSELIWITPDSLNEFDLEILRRNINSYFPHAEPLPCSIAAVLENIGYDEITGDGYSVAVVETLNSVSCVTVLTARFSEELYERVPETKGYIWERDIPRIASQGVEPDSVGYKIALVNKSGEWHNKINPYGTRHKISSNIVAIDENGEFDRYIGLNSRPVSGGLKLMALQKLACGMPIWRSKIPELMTKVFNEGTGQMEYFYFVGRDTTIEPIRGHAKRIPIDQEFVIPAGKTYFELFQGTNESTGIDGEAIEYAAFLRSPDMPFETDVVCRPFLTYTYGADDPYTLVFYPVDQSFDPIRVEWKSKTDIPAEDVPGPNFEASIKWTDLRKQINPRTQQDTDFLKWAVDRGTYMFIETDLSCVGEAYIDGDWRLDKNDKNYTHVDYDGMSVFVHQNNFVSGRAFEEAEDGGRLCFFVGNNKGRPRALCVAGTPGKTKTGFVFSVHSSLYVPFFRIWSDGRSLKDIDCPADFKREIKPVITALVDVAYDDNVGTDIRNEALFLLACMGDDMPDQAVKRLGQITNPKKNLITARTLGFALGGLNEYWQRGLLSWVIGLEDELMLNILANAAWRNPNFIPALSFDEIKEICPRLMNQINIVQTRIAKSHKGQPINSQIYSDATKFLELALALLRIRNSSDVELRRYLQPWQKRSKTLTKHVMRLSADKRFCQSAEKSRVQLDLPARLEDEEGMPALLYALKIYLTGDDRFSAIRITGINEE